jgi:DNA-binding MarR family transcriptional regulator
MSDLKSQKERAAPGPEATALDPVAEAIRQWRAHEFGAQAHMEAVANLNRMGQLLGRAIEEELRPLNVTFSQYEALVLLHFSTDGALPLGKMGRRLTVHPTTVTNTIDQLESKGLVVRERPENDRRQILARITPEGRKTAIETSEALAQIGYGLKGMSVQDSRTISRIIRDFRTKLPDIV